MINTAENPKTDKKTQTPPPQTLKYECSDGIVREVSPKKQQLFLHKAKRAGIAVKLVPTPADNPEILPQEIDFSKGLGYAYNGQPSEETKVQISNQWQQKQKEQQDNETYGDIYQNINTKYPSHKEEQSAITRRGLASNLRNVPILKDIPIVNALPNFFANMIDSDLEGVLQRKDDYQREIDLRKQDRDVSFGRTSPEEIRQQKENRFASFIENYSQNHPELTAEDRKLKYDYLQSVWDLEELEFRKRHKIFSDIHPEKQINERLDNVQQRLNYFNQLQLEDIDKKIRQEVDKGTISNFTANKLTNSLYEQYGQFSRDKDRQTKTFGSYWADWWNNNGLANTASLGYGQVVNDYYNSRKLSKLPQSIQQQYNTLQSEYNNLFGLTTKETAMYNFASGIDQTLQLMGDFALTSGAGSAANLAAKKVIINAAKQEGKKAISRVAANKAVEKLTPVLAQTATMSLLMPQMYQSALDNAQQRSGDMAAMPKFADYFDSWSRQIFENTIELYGGSAVTKKLSQSKVFSQIRQPQFLKRLSNNYLAIKQVSKSMGLNNVAEELLEEWESQLLGILAYNEGSVTDFLDPQQQALTLASVILFQSPKAASSVSYNIKQNRKAAKDLGTLQDEELAQILKITMKIPDSQQRHQALSELSPQIELLSTSAEKQSAISYILNRERQYYTDAAQTTDIREQARLKAMDIAQSFGFEHTYISPTTQEQQRDFVISMAVPKESEQTADNNQVVQNPYSNILFITSSPTEQGLVYVRQQNAKTGAFEKAKLMSLKEIADNYDVQTNLAMPFIENEVEQAAQIYEQQKQQQKEQEEFEQVELERQSRENLKKYFDQQQKDFEKEKEETDREFENITNEQTSNKNQPANTNESPQSQTGNEQSTNQPFQQGNQPLQQDSTVYLDNFNTALNTGQRPEQYTIKSIDKENDNAIIADESGSEQIIEGLNRLTPIANQQNAEQPAPETIPNDEIDFDLLLDNDPDRYFELYKEKVGQENVLEVLRSLYNNINEEIKRRKDKPKRTINSADLAKYYQEIGTLRKRAKTLETLVSREKNRKVNEKIEQQREQNQSVPSQKSDNPNDQNNPNAAQTFVPDWTEDNPADARRRGFRMVNGIRIYRQNFPPIENYTETSVEYTITEKPQPAKETIIELDTIQPSHTTSGKNPQFFLDEAQPKESRTDGDSIDGRNKALINFDNNKITFGENAYIDSSPQIKEDTREAIQGNNRLLILKKLYSNPHYKEKAENYKRFLITNAERFGMTTEQIKTMEKPVNVKVLNISDDEAIRLGQFTSENLQTGGKNYLDAKRINIKLIKADKMADFITLILYSESNDTGSISALIMNNYEVALKFLRDNVIISVGEYQTATKRDNYDNTLKELRKILEYSIRSDNNSQQLDSALDGSEGISNNVYNAVLQTSYRIFGVPEQAQFRKDLQDSIVIFWELQRDNNFRKLSGQSEEGLKRVRVFTDEWSRQTNINDFENVYVPQNKYSNLAFELAVKYKQYLSNSNEIKSMFNAMYDRLNGVLDFFEIDRQYTLAEAAKELFGIDYNGYEIKQKNGLLTGNEIVQKKEPEKETEAKLPLQIKPQQETEAISNQPELPQQPKPDTSLSKISANSNEQTEAEPATKTPTKTSDYGSNNTLVTKDRYRELQERMKQKLNQLHSGIDPEFFNIGVEMAMYHIESGTRKFASYARRMIEDLGDGIRPYLKSFYEGLRYLPQMTKYRDELDSRDYVDSFDVDNFNIEQVAETTPENNTERAVIPTPQKEPVIDTNDIKSETEQNLTKPENPTNFKQQNITNQPAKENPLKPDSPQELFSQTDDLFSDFENSTITEQPEKNTKITPTEEQTNSTEPISTAEQPKTEITNTKHHPIEAPLQPLAADKAKNRRNNHQDYSESVVPRGNAAKIKANIAAIELAYRLRNEEKDANEKDMKILRQYTGWGGLSMVFREENQHYERIRELLGEDDWEQARQSTATAFYTPPYITHSVWRMIEKLGFRGGSVLEPSAGIGNFFATMPQALADRSDLTAVEIDNTSGLILQLLYPDADVEITGFQDRRISNNSQDLIVTNVPFGNYNVYDKNDKDLSKRFKNIHDYFIAKSVRKLKAGGLGVFITTSGTMDRSRDLRQWVISEGNADFIDAVRLNTDTFKQEAGTEVTSDVVIIRKRDANGKSSFAKDMLDCQTEREASYEDGEQYNKKTYKQEPVIKTASMFYNKYFHDNSNRLSGVMKFGFEGGNRLRKTEQRLEPTSDKAL